MSNAEALRDLLTFLNTTEFAARKTPTSTIVDGEETPFHIFDNRVHASYATLRMGSVFRAIHFGDAIGGYEGFLAVGALAGKHATTAPVSIAELVWWPVDTAEIVYLDRLSRTLHTLNFLAQGARVDLHLNVHPQHLLAVPTDHGRVFENILAQCGLLPDQIVLEVPEHAVRDKSRLQEAIAAWQSRRYRIAIDSFGIGQAQFARVLNLRPDIIKFDGEFLAQQLDNNGGYRRLADFLQRAHAQGIKTIATGIDSRDLHESSKQLGFTAAQGSYLDTLHTHRLPLATSAQQVALGCG